MSGQLGRNGQNWAELGRIGQNWAELGRIWISKLRGRGTEKEKKKKKKEEEEKISHMCESIGHRPLRGRCPKRGKGDDQSKYGNTSRITTDDIGLPG